MIKYCIFFLCLLVLPMASFSQFEGVIAYEVNYEALDASKKDLLSMLPQKSLLYIKGEHSLFEQEVAGGGKQAFYIDAGKGSGMLVMQFLGQGYKVEMNQEEIESLKKAKALDFNLTEGEQTVSGYTCKKAVAISGTDTLKLFYSPELRSDSPVPPFAEVDGIPLKYEMIKGGVKMTYIATLVKKTTIEASTFKSAPDMKSMDFSDFAKSFAITQ